MPPKRILKILLYVISAHSFCVGLALITTPIDLFAYFGYHPVTEKFFPVQGGVFHLIMSVAYYLAARFSEQEQGLIILTIITKLTATVFLFFYYVFIHQVWMILVSGLVDGLMAAAVFIVYREYKKEQAEQP